MTTVIVGMLVALLLALGVVALVAVPARREGRELLTPQGEQLVQQARDRVVDLRDRLPTSGRSAQAPDGGPPATADTPVGSDPVRQDPRGQQPPGPRVR
jgi:hypothetical protein